MREKPEEWLKGSIGKPNVEVEQWQFVYIETISVNNTLNIILNSVVLFCDNSLGSECALYVCFFSLMYVIFVYCIVRCFCSHLSLMESVCVVI